MDNVATVQCKQCQNKFKNVRSLHAHIRNIHIRNNGYKQKEVPIKDSSYECHICKKVFKHKNAKHSLQIHLRIHTGEKPYSCTSCERGFADQSALINHEKTHDLNRETISCEYCGNCFYEKKNLRHHLKICKHSEMGAKVLPKVKTYFCTECGKGCVSEWNLKKHTRTQHIEYKKPLTMKKYGREMKAEVGKYAIKFSVDEAGKKYDVPSGTIRRWVKLLIKPKNCSECPEIFASINELNQHIKVRHKYMKQIKLEDHKNMSDDDQNINTNFTLNTDSKVLKNIAEKDTIRYNKTVFEWENDISENNVSKNLELLTESNIEESKKDANNEQEVPKMVSTPPEPETYDREMHDSEIELDKDIFVDKAEPIIKGNESNDISVDLLVIENESNDTKATVSVVEQESTSLCSVQKVLNIKPLVETSIKNSGNNENSENATEISKTENKHEDNENITKKLFDKDGIEQDDDSLIESSIARHSNEVEQTDAFNISESDFNKKCDALETIEDKNNKPSLLIRDCKAKELNSMVEEFQNFDADSKIKMEDEEFFLQSKLMFDALQSPKHELYDDPFSAIDEHKSDIKKALDIVNFKIEDENFCSQKSSVKQNKEKKNCPYCGKKFRSISEVQRHEMTHTRVKPFSCEDCGLQFRFKSSIQRHRKITHTHEKENILEICSHCGKAFTQKTNLLIHERSHTGQKPFKCDLCSQTYRLECHLEKHRFKDHNNPYHMCDLCGKGFIKFKFKRAWYYHQKKCGKEMSKKEPKNYNCQFCEKVFPKKDACNRHMKSHTKQKDFVCSECGKEYADKRNLLTHSSSHGIIST